jgi:hypothetical protein
MLDVLEEARETESPPRQELLPTLIPFTKPIIT